MWHHQNTAFTLRMRERPRWFLSMSRKRAFRLSAALFVLGSGPASVSDGSRYVNSVPSETSRDSDERALRSLSCVNTRLPSMTVVSSRKSAQNPHHCR